MAHTYTDIPAAGSDLRVYLNSAYVSIPGVHEISFDGFKLGVRNPNRTAENYVRKRKGRIDYGQMKFKVWYDPNDATHQALVQLIAGSTAYDDNDQWKLIYADGFNTPANVTFTGFLSEFTESGIDADNGTVVREGTIEIDSITAFTAGSPPE